MRTEKEKEHQFYICSTWPPVCRDYASVLPLATPSTFKTYISLQEFYKCMAFLTVLLKNNKKT